MKIVILIFVNHVSFFQDNTHHVEELSHDRECI